MELTKETIEAVLSDHFRRCRIAQSIGLALRDVVDGEPIPDGWRLDPETYYYLPPNVKLL